MSTTNANIFQVGDSWLDVTGSGVRCPGCRRSTPTSPVLQHADGCPVSGQIEAALLAFDLLDVDPDVSATPPRRVWGPRPPRSPDLLLGLPPTRVSSPDEDSTAGEPWR